MACPISAALNVCGTPATCDGFAGVHASALYVEIVWEISTATVDKLETLPADWVIVETGHVSSARPSLWRHGAAHCDEEDGAMSSVRFRGIGNLKLKWRDLPSSLSTGIFSR